MTYTPKPVMQPGETLCRVSEIADPGSKEFRFATPRGPRFLFLVKKDGRIFAYQNWCPHVGGTLDWKPDTFLNHDKSAILCALHGAEFTIEDGVCFLGPCEGRKLRPVPIRIEDDRIVLATKVEEPAGPFTL